MAEILKCPTLQFLHLYFLIPHVNNYSTYFFLLLYRLGSIDLSDLQNSKGNQEIVISAGAESGFLFSYFMLSLFMVRS